MRGLLQIFLKRRALFHDVKEKKKRIQDDQNGSFSL